MFWPMTLTHRLDNVVNRMLTAIHASMSAQQASTMGMFPRGHGLVQHAGREQRPAQARHHGQRLQYERAQEQASLPADVHKAAPDHFPS